MAESIPPNLARKRLAAIYRRHDEWTTEVLGAFEDKVEQITLKSVTALTSKLQDALNFAANGALAHTPSNLRTLGRIDRVYQQSLDQYGYARTIHSFIAEFPGQLPLLPEVLQTVADTLQTPFTIPSTLLTGSDKAALKTQQIMSGETLADLAVTLGTQAKRKALLSVGGLDRQTLTETLSEQLGKMRGEAATLGATSLSIFYRTASAQVFQKVASANKETLRFVYDGPEDKLNRPFCVRLLKQRDKSRTWTKAEIDRMDNGMLPNVFVTCGAWNCRHQWRIALPDELGII